jgi:2-polyprenyl-3-methyl-5-hydroxy-6-metoxy-1,4-benzoquinol methylase
MKNPKDIVADGYDKASYAYREDSLDTSDECYIKYKNWIDELSGKLIRGCSVLDLGCGCGVPAARLLARRFRVTGVDISPVQIERARKLVPDASFVCGDMCELDISREEYDAVVCLYAIIHVPVAEQLELLARIRSWLKPGGYFLLSAGQREWTGEEENWLKVDGCVMYWSHADRDTYVRWLEGTGFSIVWVRFVPEGEGGHSLIFTVK